MWTDSTMAETKENAEFTSEQRIQNFFKGTTVFLTGVTGFVGQVLFSKLLCSCSGIKTIYILIREKNGIDVNSRLQKLLETPVFENLKKCNPDYLSKVVTIKGDCSLPNLGISETDLSLLRGNVNIVFHMAAFVNFEASLRDAVNSNIRSTSNLLDLAQDMKNLQVFIQISTCFSFCADRKVIEEKLYEPPMQPQHIINLVDSFNDEILNEITPSLLGPYPNTYLFTKAIAESLFLDKKPHLPIAIFRPAIVISTAEDPIPGWINNLYGPTGVVATSGMGLLRSLLANGNMKANLVPCDYLINAIIASAWYTAETWKSIEKNDGNENSVILNNSQVPVFNYSSTEIKTPLTWRMLETAVKSIKSDTSPTSSMWAYSLTLNENKFVHKLYVLFLHTLPAILIDGVAFVCGKQPRLLKSYRKIHKLMDAISYFSTREWIVPHDNVDRLWSRLSEHDKLIFKFNLEDLNWETYLRNYIHGVRLQFIKANEDDIPYVIKKGRLFIFALYTVIAIFIIILWQYLLK